MIEDGQKMDLYFIFAKSTLTMKGVVSSNDPEVGEIVISVNVPCTYTRKGDKVNVKTNPNKAKINIEVVNYVITDNENGTITLTKDSTPISGQVFSTTGGATVTATSTTGVYKVTGTGTISFKYKGVVVADVTI